MKHKGWMEEEFAHATEGQYVPVEVDINIYDDYDSGMWNMLHSRQ